MIATIDVEIQAANPCMPLYPWRAFKGSSTSLRIRNVPKKIGTWQITAVDIQVEYPDNSIFRKQAKLVGGVWIATLDGSSLSGLVTNGYSIIANGIDEDGNFVSDYILGKGDVEILDSDSIIEAGIDVSVVKLYKSKPSEIKNGDCWFEDDILVICDNDIEKRIEGFKPTANQLAVLNSGITSNKVANYDSAYAKIPAQTFEPNNELADKSFVNSSVQTATANFRGNWTTFEDVPSNADDYPEDYQGNKTPTTNDYMVVENLTESSYLLEVGGDGDTIVYITGYEINGDTATINAKDPLGNEYTVTCVKPNNRTDLHLKNGFWYTLIVANVQTGEFFDSPSKFGCLGEGGMDYGVIQPIETARPLGTWRFKYVGNWDVDNKNGWKKEYQVNETPLTSNQLATLNSGFTSNDKFHLNQLYETVQRQYKFVNLSLTEEYNEEEDWYYSYYELQPFNNNILVDGTYYDDIYVSSTNINTGVIRDLMITINNVYYSEQFFWDEHTYVPVNEDVENISVTEGKTNIFYLTEFTPGRFLVSKQLV